MDQQSFPALNINHWTTSENEVDTLKNNHAATGEVHAMANVPAVDAADKMSNVGMPISSIMDKTLWIVNAEDTIEKVEETLAMHGLTSIPVLGSNGAIVGMIGIQELALFHAEKKNAKAVRAWEISRIKAFEVSPGDTVEDVANFMAESKIENIAVTELGGLKGVISTQDLVQVILKKITDDASHDSR